LSGEALRRYKDAKNKDAKRRRIAKGGLTAAQRREKAEERKRQHLAAKEAKRIAREQAKADKIKACPWLDPKLSRSESWRMRNNLDPVFNMQQRFRAHAKRGRFGMWAKLGCRLRDAMIRGKDVQSTYAPLVDYTAQQLRDHLQRQFTKGMTWEKFCAGEIHIDHRIPLSSFDMADEQEARRAWSLTNLQPLWSVDNIRKGKRRMVLL